MIRFGLPLLRKELLERSSTRRHYVERVAFALIVCGVFVIWMSNLSADQLFTGEGRWVFTALYWVTCAVIFVGVPATVAGAIPAERERGSLDLLRVTTLSSLEIVLEKFLGRLLPFTVILLIQLPVVAGLYAYGGLTEGRLWLAALSLALLTLQVGALALLAGVSASSPARALSRSFAVLLVIYGILPLGALASRLGPEVAFAHVPMTSYFALETGTALWVRSAFVIAGAVGCVLLTRTMLWRTPLRQVMALRRKQALSAEHGRPSDIARRRRASVSDDRPVRWRVLRSNHWYMPPFLVVAGGAVIGLSIALSAGIWGVGIFVHQAMNVILWLLLFFVTVTRSVDLLLAERSKQTLDVLLTTPLTGREIVAQKVAPMWRVIAWLALVSGVVAAIGIQMWVANPLPYLEVDEDRLVSLPVAMLRTMAASALCAVAWLFSATWLAVWVGLRASHHSRAVLGVILLWVVCSYFPLLAAWVTAGVGGWFVPGAVFAIWWLHQSARYGVSGPARGLVLGLLGLSMVGTFGGAGFEFGWSVPMGPLTTLGYFSTPYTEMLGEWLSPLLGLLLYFNAGLALRFLCLAGADELMRRGPKPRRNT